MMMTKTETDLIEAWLNNQTKLASTKKSEEEPEEKSSQLLHNNPHRCVLLIVDTVWIWSLDLRGRLYTDRTLLFALEIGWAQGVVEKVIFLVGVSKHFLAGPACKIVDSAREHRLVVIADSQSMNRLMAELVQGLLLCPITSQDFTTTSQFWTIVEVSGMEKIILGDTMLWALQCNLKCKASRI